MPVCSSDLREDADAPLSKPGFGRGTIVCIHLLTRCGAHVGNEFALINAQFI